MTGRPSSLTRLAAAGAGAALIVAVLMLLGPREGRGPEVVLYSSVDDYLVREVVREFERETGIAVLLVGDTEATKTTGLVHRLIAERRRPRADVWWSSEPFGTMRLAEEGLLEPYRSIAEEEMSGSWPAELRDPEGLWYGFGSRARVIVYNTRRVPPERVPRTLRELAAPAWQGRVGMARPQFGTTRGHMGALTAACGGEAFREWLTAMRAGGLRLYDGNASVVRAVAYGEIDAGLTDTDDVWSGQGQGWPVALAFESVDGTGPGLCSFGPLRVPNTIARVRGGPNPDAAGALIDFVLSERVERMLAASDSHNAPVRPAVAAEFSAWAVPPGRTPDLASVARAMPEALRICDEVLGSR